MKYLLNCRSFIFLMVLFSFFDNFGTEGETKKILNSDDSFSKYDHLFKVVFVGDAVVGKTQIIDKFVGNKFSAKYASTVGVDFKVKIVECEKKKIKLQLWDTAGQEKYRSVTKSYYKGSHLIVFVYAINNKKSFENIQSCVKYVKNNTNKNPKFLLVGNKLDLEDKRQVTKEEAQEYAKENEMEFIEVSAKEKKNIEDMFNPIIKELLDDMKAEEKKEKIQVKNLDKDIDDINHNNNDLSCCNKYCSCCPCLKKSEENVEEQEKSEDQNQDKDENNF